MEIGFQMHPNLGLGNRGGESMKQVIPHLFNAAKTKPNQKEKSYSLPRKYLGLNYNKHVGLACGEVVSVLQQHKRAS